MSKDYKISTGNANASSGGIGALSVLQIIFIVLKVLKMVSWSWWAVFIPTFIGLGLSVLLWLIAMIVIIVAYTKERKS